MTKEEVQGKIDKGEPMYYHHRKKVKEIMPTKDDDFGWWDKQMSYINMNDRCEYKLSELFSTREEAEWHNEFGNIKRVEKLTLPTYEETQSDRHYSFRTHFSCNNTTLSVHIYNFTKSIEIYWRNGIHTYDKKIDKSIELNKENYLKACRLIKELFKKLEDKQ